MADFKAFSPTAWRAFTSKCAALFPFLKKTFVGTQAEWDALTSTEQANYDIVNITDDEGEDVVVVDEVAEGNLNAVTSNAVAQSLPSFILIRLHFTVNAAASSTQTAITASSDISIPAGKYLVSGTLTDIDMGIDEGLVLLDAWGLNALNNFTESYRPPLSTGVTNIPLVSPGIATVTSAITIASGGTVGDLMDYTCVSATQVNIQINLVKVA